MISSILKTPIKSVKKYLTNYSLGLIITREKRNCTKIAFYLGISHDSVYRFLAKAHYWLPFFPRIMINIVKYFSKNGHGWLILDDTAISKIFSRFIEGTGYIYNSALGRTERGMSIVVLAWSNGKITIPIAFKCWHSKEIIGVNSYKTKIELAKELIGEISSQLSYEYLLADGLYFSKAMVSFLNENSICFEMRIPSNRKIETSDGVAAKLKLHHQTKLRGNQKAKTIKATWNGIQLFFTTHKRINKCYEFDIVYQVSNMIATPHSHVNMYEQRWEIEKMFRTMKQQLGLAHCSARGLSKQKIHIYAVFYGYAFLQKEKVIKKFSTVEDVATSFRDVKLKGVRRRISSFNEVFAYVA